MNTFTRLVLREACICIGGIRCAYCTPRATSSAGSRRHRARKTRSRRAARRTLRLSLRTGNTD